MPHVLRCLTAFALLTVTALAAPEPEPAAEKPEKVEPAAKPLEPIVEVEKIEPNATVFKKSTVQKPLELKSAEDAKEYFDEKALAMLVEEVDFEKQVVLVFAWRGSGQDKLNFAVAESFPEQVHFTLKRGFTRDLRPHVHVYALRSNVKWSTKK